jgi:hypothetical protein
MLTVRRNLSVPLFNTTPKRLNTQGLSPSDSIVIAFRVTILTTAFVTNWRCSNDEEELSISI